MGSLPPPLLGRRAIKILASGVTTRARKRVRLPGFEFPYGPPAVPDSVEPQVDSRLLGAAYDSSWARKPLPTAARRALLESVLRPSIRVLARPEVIGLGRLEGLHSDQNAIFAANHHSHLDTSLLLSAIPRPWRHQMVVAAAADYFFDTPSKAYVSALAMGATPIERKGATRASADELSRLIGQGYSVVIYPEGGRSPDGWGQPFKGGAAYLANRGNAPVVPVFIGGTDKIWPKGKALPTPGRSTVVFGEPMWATAGESTRRFNSRIESTVAALSDELASNWWQARRRFHSNETETLEGPAASSWRRAWALSSRGLDKQRRSWP